jgi:hypothetical protein
MASSSAAAAGETITVALGARRLLIRFAETRTTRATANTAVPCSPWP